MRYYTGIGSRQTPPNILAEMGDIALYLADHDWTLRSGHADGADLAFEVGASEYTGKDIKHIYLPWRGFNGAPYRHPDYIALDDVSPDIANNAMSIARRFHPAWDRCSTGAKKLHARNVLQIFGHGRVAPSEMVICWTPGGRLQGGTAQAMRIAAASHIPIFNLALDEDLRALEDFVQSFNQGE